MVVDVGKELTLRLTQSSQAGAGTELGNYFGLHPSYFLFIFYFFLFSITWQHSEPTSHLLTHLIVDAL